MKIVVTSVMVDDQRKALKFYTEKLGFVKKHDIPMGGEYSWLTVISPESGPDIEVLLEPMGFAPARDFQKQLFEAGIPATMFGVDDLQADYERLLGLGVQFHTPPRDMVEYKYAVFEDTCGNLIQIVQR